ncbi:hypothetical protein 2011_scaffold152_00026 [Bacteriophage sp.]|nr:hypothetical protein 2011_scaffold152_00026 [Bacteriophage sp.]
MYIFSCNPLTVFIFALPIFKYFYSKGGAFVNLSGQTPERENRLTYHKDRLINLCQWPF